MSTSTLIEVFGHILFSFTRGVTEHYNPEEPEFTAELFGYSPLESTGREWYYHPVDELIYQEYSDREATSLDYLASYGFDVKVTDACSKEENEETQEEHLNEDESMAWKRLRPSFLHTSFQSMYIGAWISLLMAIIVGTISTMVLYLSFETVQHCEFHSVNSTSIQMQWMRSMSDVIACAFKYIWFFILVLFLFRPFQLMGIKRKLFLACLITYSLDTIYRVVLQASGISHSHISYSLIIPLKVLFLSNQCMQVYILTKYFCSSSQKKMPLFFKMVVPSSLGLLASVLGFYLIIYPAYNKENSIGKLLIATFSPLVGVVVKVASRICVQNVYITHPGYSYVLLSPVYCGAAVLFRVLQADLGSLQAIALLGIIHGAAEVIERSTMVLIDHICHMLWKRRSTPWGSFRTPRRERLMADIAIISMLYESAAIVSVNGFLYLHQFIYVREETFSNLFQSFAIHTSVSLAIEWVFSSVSLAIETRYQNLAVMAVARRNWKRHLLVAIVNAVPIAFWTSSNLLDILDGRLNEILNRPCKMPFT